ncbi:putative disease resistance protein rga3 [Phtheirospermum japonicum]|uniref:Putative disease resistance protein rga3 n=1 Tax=Phtheirospermum japonicum TaxID=374723 RepID=A0A830CEX2_9LAMI|nr:putative disease resistance protein rga3 [Phtheirospermum japonicum]
MHDLVHDLAFSVLCENDNVTYGVCQRRYIGCESNGDGLLSIAKGQERYVRTLFFSGKLSDIRFSDFKSLHTLTLLSEEDIDELPDSIGELKHLRYLDISETRIKYLPNSVGELYHLQTLRANHDSTVLPPEMGNLTSLQTLPYFHVGRKKGCGILELGSLENLKGKLEICNLEQVCDENEATKADLLGKQVIYELKLVWDKSREGDEANDESVLEGLKPHPNLKGLEICGFKGKSLRLWERLNNLMKIKLEDCSECEEVPMLGHLPRLKSLCLDGLTNVKSIRSSFYGNIDPSVVVFPALERLELLSMPNLKEWDEVEGLNNLERLELLDMPNLQEWDEVVVFPCLEYLKVEGCRQLMRAPSHFPCLQELEIRGMESSLALENICGIKLTTLTHLQIYDIEGVKCLPDELFSNNHNLMKLEIGNCPKMTHLVPCLGGGGAPSLLRELVIWYCSSLRELPYDLHSLNYLEVFHIEDCPDVKSIPFPISSRRGGQRQQGFTSLRELRIWNCKGLTNLPIEMVESCALSLERLRLYKLSSITNMGMVIGCLHRMTRLTELTIGGVPGFVPELSNSSSWNNVSFNETVDAILLQPSQFISLRQLRLNGAEHWDSLPDQLQHLTSLEYLRLDDFGIEALPEWFGNLSSLKRLELFSCKKLRHLPPKQAMQRLSKFTYLYIYECPLLILKEKKIVDSEWHKISHIPDIYVDTYRISSDRY